MWIDELLTEEERLELDLMELEAVRSLDTSLFIDDIAPVYRDNLDNMARIQILYGGSSSGKSVSKAQQAVLEVLQGGRNWLICRKVGKDSRHSTFVEVNKVISQWDLYGRFKINKTDLTITCDNGYQILFKGLDDLEKLKSITAVQGAITDIWIEEATQTQSDDIKQLLRRQRGGDVDTPKRLHLTFNPILKLSWIYQEYFAPIGWAEDQSRYDGDSLTIQKTTYKDNPFLGQDEIDTLENETDEYWYNVYTLGNWGVLGDVIFRNWGVEDLSGMRDQFTNHRHGLDFGFSSDPAAIVATHYDRNQRTIYIYNELYERGLTNDILAQEASGMIGSHYVKCDSAEPKSIEELRRHGINAIGARKGKDSVIHGIQWLQQQTIIVDSSCINAQNEFMLYQWKKDKDGNSLRQPVDKMNHIIDALRYAYEDEALTVQTQPNPFYD